MKFRKPYKFEKSYKAEKDVPLMEAGEIEKEVEHELDESLPIINFASCTNDELIEFMIDFFDLTLDKEELLHFCVIYFAAVAEEAAKVTEIVA